MGQAFKIERKNEESSKQLVGRFMKRFRKSGILRRAKKSIYRGRPLSRKLKIKAALRRRELVEHYKKMDKMGKI